MALAALVVTGTAGACQQPVTASAGTPVSTHRPPSAKHGASPSPVPSDYPGDTTSASWGSPVVAENFNGTRLDPAKWVVYNSPNDRVNPRTSSATRLSGGALTLTGGLYGGRDLSGGIASTLNQRYGRWEVRLKADRGVGYSAVALLWPERMGHPEYAEIDFAEIIDPNRRGAGIFIHHGPADNQAQNVARADFTKWHVVAVDWLPDRLTFWLDGKVVWTYRGPLIPHLGRMGLALQNDQVCDRGPGFCRNHTTPKWVTMSVDWVKIYRVPSR